MEKNWDLVNVELVSLERREKGAEMLETLEVVEVEQEQAIGTEADADVAADEPVSA